MQRKKSIINLLFVFVIAVIAGISLYYNELSRLSITILLVSLPVIFYLVHKPFDYILKCMLIVVFFVPFQYMEFLNPFNVLNPLIILGAILCVSIFKQLILEKRVNNFNLTIIDKLYFLFILFALVSTFSAISVLGSLNWIFYSITTGYVVYKAITSLEHAAIYRILRFLVLIGFICALYGVLENIIAQRSLIFDKSYGGRLSSFLGHPLLNGIIFSSILPISLALYFKSREKKFILSSTVIFMAIILTFSRGSWFALLCGLVLMGILSPVKIRVKLFLIFLISAIAIALIPPLSQPIKSRLTQDEKAMYSSFNVRIKSIPIALKIIKDKPFFGGGPFNAAKHKDEYGTNLTLRKTTFENSYLSFLVDLGFLGFGVLLLIYLAVLKKSFLNLRVDDEFRICRIAVFSAFIILAINMATFNFNSYRQFHFVTWFFIGLNVALSKRNI